MKTHNYLTVVFDKELGEDRIDVLKSAIMQLKNVISVESGINNYEAYANKCQLRYEIHRKLIDTLFKETA